MLSSLDEVIRDRFLVLDRSVDDLLCHPGDAELFAGDVNRIAGDSVPTPQVLARLIALRKLGQDKGGLPRTKRRYHGRGSSPR